MDKAAKIILILLIIVLGLLFYLKSEDRGVTQENPSLEAQSEKLKIFFLDIGHGDATFIEFPTGEQMLVDCAIDARIIEALGRVMEFYDHDLDYLLVTHPDLDHYGGCTDVLKRFEVKNIVYNGLKKKYDEQWQEFWQSVQDEKAEYHELVQEDVWTIASTSLHFLYPDHAIVEDSKIPGADKEPNANNTSIVFELEYQGKEVLLTGDAEEELEEYLISTYGDQLGTDVLKVGHHGSGSSSMQEFLDKATPIHSIISCGKNNRFGHPSRRVLKRLERVGSTVWRTDQQNDIILEIDNKGKIYVEAH